MCADQTSADSCDVVACFADSQGVRDVTNDIRNASQGCGTSGDVRCCLKGGFLAGRRAEGKQKTETGCGISLIRSNEGVYDLIWLSGFLYGPFSAIVGVGDIVKA